MLVAWLRRDSALGCGADLACAGRAVAAVLVQRASEPTKTRKRMNEMPNEKKNFFGIGSDTPGTQLGVVRHLACLNCTQMQQCRQHHNGHRAGFCNPGWLGR